MPAAEIFDLPQTPVWALASGLSGAILGHWLGRLHERKSKKEAARVALLSCVSSWSYKVETSDDMIQLRKDSLHEIERELFAFVPHVSRRKKKGAESVLREYRDLNDQDLYEYDIVKGRIVFNKEKSVAAKKVVLNALVKIGANAKKG